MRLLCYSPVIIKYPFWCMTAKNSHAVYACINQGQAACPPEIEERSICINAEYCPDFAKPIYGSSALTHSIKKRPASDSMKITCWSFWVSHADAGHADICRQSRCQER